MPNIKPNLIRSEDTGPDLAVIHEAAKLIGSAETPQIAITSILRLISQMLGLNRGRVLLPSITNDKLTIRYSYGLLDEEQLRGVYSLNDLSLIHI